MADENTTDTTDVADTKDAGVRWVLVNDDNNMVVNVGTFDAGVTPEEITGYTWEQHDDLIQGDAWAPPVEAAAATEEAPAEGEAEQNA